MKNEITTHEPDDENEFNICVEAITGIGMQGTSLTICIIVNKQMSKRTNGMINN